MKKKLEKEQNSYKIPPQINKMVIANVIIDKEWPAKINSTIIKQNGTMRFVKDSTMCHLPDFLFRFSYTYDLRVKELNKVIYPNVT